MVEVVAAADRRQLRAFLQLPWTIYRGDPYWVPPLRDQQRELFDPTRHPFHEHGSIQPFLALRDGRVVGRIAAITNGQHERARRERIGFFGFFESVDDPHVAAALFAAARGWLGERGYSAMRGPVNPDTNHECGLLIEGHGSRPAFMMPYNPSYYPLLFESVGLHKAKDLYAYRMDRTTADPAHVERLAAVAERLKERSRMEVRIPSMRRFAEEAEFIREVYERAWYENWGFVPLTRGEFDHLARQLKQLIVPEFVRFVSIDGRPAGFALMLPDYNQALRRINGRLWPLGLPILLASYHLKRIEGLRLLMLGVVHEYQRRGIDAVLVYELYRQAIDTHYRWCEVSWVLEDNVVMNNTLRPWGRLYKTYRIYEGGCL